MRKLTSKEIRFWGMATLFAILMMVMGMIRITGFILIIIGSRVMFEVFAAHLAKGAMNILDRRTYGEKCDANFAHLMKYLSAFALIGLGAGMTFFGIPGILGLIIAPAIVMFPLFHFTYGNIPLS